MNDSGHDLPDAGLRFYWCVEHDRVESGDERCPLRNLLGPYPSLAAAERALDTVRRRNDEADAEERRWD